ncbi:MAG: 4-hydroxy-tetrahydrodipicolinate reductase [Acidimicrobiales bacterium]|nr:4-hydroxy-tetrahydrodipicolinate reductase [Acidimicrobiales bacterium]
MTEPIRVGVFGAAGRMGRAVCAAVNGDPALRLVAAVDPFAEGAEVEGLVVAKEAHAMADAGVQVAVDFTIIDAARVNAAWCATHGIHDVIGTSGFSDKDLDDLRHLFSGDGAPNCVVAANFAIGAVLTGYLAAKAAPFFETVEIIEAHHDTKKDAPSGTALDTASRIAAASSEWAADPTEIEHVPGARGAKGAGGIPIHAVRMRGMIATQEVIFGATGQTLTLRHDTFDRTSFMPGVLLAAKAIPATPGLTIGLDALLGLD